VSEDLIVTGPTAPTADLIVTGPTAPTTTAVPLTDFIAQALTNPAIDVGKLEALLRLHKEVTADGNRVVYMRALAAAQAEIAPIAKTKLNPSTNSKFAPLDVVDAALRPIYTRHGFSLSFDEEVMPGSDLMIIACICSHVSGHSEKYRLIAPPDTLGAKGTAVKTQLHGRASTVTFLRRYLECNIFNVVLKNQDDDGVRGGMSFINRQQVAELETLITETRTDATALLHSYFENAVRTLAEVPPGWFGPIKNYLIKKQKALAGPAQ
jgi:hypothetical protein